MKLQAIFLIAVSILLSSCSNNNDGGTVYIPSDDIIGHWTGTWSNTTFGSNGPLTLDITDNGNGTLDVTFDLDGFVGGMFDPAPQTVTATIGSTGDITFSGNIDMVGMPGQLDFTFKSNGELSISLPSIPIAGFDSFTATGSMTPTNLSLDYEVFFSPAGSAVGTATATKS